MVIDEQILGLIGQGKDNEALAMIYKFTLPKDGSLYKTNVYNGQPF